MSFLFPHRKFFYGLQWVTRYIYTISHAESIALRTHRQLCHVILAPLLPHPLQTSSTRRPPVPTTLRRSIHKERSTPQRTQWARGHATASGTPRPPPTPTPSPPYWGAASPTSRPPVPTPWLDDPSLAASQRTWPSRLARDATTPAK